MKLLLNTLKLIQDNGPWKKDLGLCHNVQYITDTYTSEKLSKVFKLMQAQGLVSDAVFPVKGGAGSYAKDFRSKSFWRNQHRWDLLDLTIRFMEAGCPPNFGESKWTRLLRFLRLS